MKTWRAAKFWWHLDLWNVTHEYFFNCPKNTYLQNLVAKQVLTEKKNQIWHRGSNIKVWIGISSFLSHEVTCINVILWFHKSRSSFYPWGCFGNLKHGSAVLVQVQICMYCQWCEEKKSVNGRHIFIFDYNMHLSEGS